MLGAQNMKITSGKNENQGRQNNCSKKCGNIGNVGDLCGTVDDRKDCGRLLVGTIKKSAEYEVR